MNYLNCIFLALYIIFIGQDVFANDLPLNDADFKKIQLCCPECIENHVLVCGNQNIGFGKSFLKNFFQGKPLKGFLITPPILASNFKDLMRHETNYEKLNSIVMDMFSKLKLIVINGSFKNIITLTDPKVGVDIPEKLHDCLIMKDKKWGCGVSINSGQECCEKRLGSPLIKVVWEDKDCNELAELQYNPAMGSSKIIRRNKDNTNIIYYCLTSELAKLLRK